MANYCFCELKMTGLKSHERDWLLGALIDKKPSSSIAIEHDSDCRNSPNEERGSSSIPDKTGELDAKMCAWFNRRWVLHLADWIEESDIKVQGDSVYCDFIARWSPPISCMGDLCDLFPESTIVLRYKEYSMSFAGVYVACNGHKEDVRIDTDECFEDYKKGDPLLANNPLLDNSAESDIDSPDPTQEEYDEFCRHYDNAVNSRLDCLEEGLICEFCDEISTRGKKMLDGVR